MRLELVNTGTELLLGDTINTNAAWLGQRLAALGIDVARQTIVPDGRAVFEGIEEAARRSDVVLVTGGLGPTNDDVTRECAAELYDLPLDLHEGVMAWLTDYFGKRGKPVNEASRRQAMVPRGAAVLENRFGTAPGLHIPAVLGSARGLHAHIFLLPGPPRELKPMMEHAVEPVLRGMLADGGAREVLYLKSTGIGESDIVDKIQVGLEAIADLDLGYCIGRGDVDIRLSGPRDVVAAGAHFVRERMGDFIVSEDRRVIEEVVVALLRERRQWVATAESCTGGLLACRITDVSGASEVLGEGYVAYANAAKQKLLGVKTETLAAHGAVSEAVVCEMAEGCLRASGADHALALTGVAGPAGGTPEKPAGTVWIALASGGETTEARKLFFPGARDRFKLLASQAALELLRRRLRGIPIPS
ncbi:MAG: competence/damage-inducible protein A [Verrucomicrobiaceae bacterium]|nr:competence/damage-inducible protein A [Verrucomicrobiaceae bacterium]